MIDTSGTNIKSLLSLSAVYCDLEDALQKSIDLITVSSLEQRPQMENDVRFRDTVLKERVNLCCRLMPSDWRISAITALKFKRR